MSVIREFSIGGTGDTSACTTSTNTNSNNVSIHIDAPQPSGHILSVPSQGQNLTPQGSASNFQTLGMQQTPPPQPPIVASATTTDDPCAVAYQSTFPPEAQVNIEALTQRVAMLENELEFYQLLSRILSGILKDNNPKLIANVIDCTGKIIVSGEELVRLIAIKTGKDAGQINLRYRDEEPGCMTKISPIKNISDIKIDNESFSLKYNRDYNILKDDFNISLERVIIAPPITYR